MVLYWAVVSYLELSRAYGLDVNGEFRITWPRNGDRLEQDLQDLRRVNGSVNYIMFRAQEKIPKGY
jgi:hypothetical protein